MANTNALVILMDLMGVVLAIFFLKTLLFWTIIDFNQIFVMRPGFETLIIIKHNLRALYSV